MRCNSICRISLSAAATHCAHTVSVYCAINQVNQTIHRRKRQKRTLYQTYHIKNLASHINCHALSLRLQIMCTVYAVCYIASNKKEVFSNKKKHALKQEGKRKVSTFNMNQYL